MGGRKIERHGKENANLDETRPRGQVGAQLNTPIHGLITILDFSNRSSTKRRMESSFVSVSRFSITPTFFVHAAETILDALKPLDANVGEVTKAKRGV